MLENPAPPSRKFSSLVLNSSIERSSHVTPIPYLLLRRRKVPLKTSLHFPITITICKQWSKFETCSRSPGAVGDKVVPKDIVIRFIDYAEKKWLFHNFDPVTLGKNERGRGPRCPPVFWSFKKGVKF